MKRCNSKSITGGMAVVMALAVAIVVAPMPARSASIVWRSGICGSHYAPFLGSGACMLLRAMAPEDKRVSRNTLEATRRIVERRVKDRLGLRTAASVRLITHAGQWVIEVDLPGFKKNLQSVESLIQQTGQLTIVALGSTSLPRGASTKGYKILAGSTDVVGRNVRVIADQFGGPAVDVTVKDPAAAAIYNYTQAHVGGYLGIAIDNKVYDSPTIQDAVLGGTFQITNLGSIDAAKNLAIMLKYGPLPIPLMITSVEEISGHSR